MPIVGLHICLHTSTYMYTRIHASTHTTYIYAHKRCVKGRWDRFVRPLIANRNDSQGFQAQQLGRATLTLPQKRESFVDGETALYSGHQKLGKEWICKQKRKLTVHQEKMEFYNTTGPSTGMVGPSAALRRRPNSDLHPVVLRGEKTNKEPPGPRDRKGKRKHVVLPSDELPSPSCLRCVMLQHWE